MANKVEVGTKTIMVVVSNGGIVDVSGIPEGVVLKVIDKDFETPLAHIYNADLTEEHREVTEEEEAELEEDECRCHDCGWEGRRVELMEYNGGNCFCPECQSEDVEDKDCGMINEWRR